MAFDLNSIATTGKEVLPPRIVIHGPHGIGKSTFGAASLKPVFIATEDGLSAIQVDAFPKAESFSVVAEALQKLASGDHEFRTVVLDSADWLESLIWTDTAHEHGHRSIEDFGYGKGYVFALDRWRKLTAAFDYLRTHKKMASIIICHTDIRRFDSPETDPYDRYQLKLNAKAGAILQEWADIVAFANHQVVIREKNVGFDKKAARGVATGERMLYFHEQPAFAAKTRFALPKSLPLGWDTFASAFAEATNPKNKTN